MVDLHTHTDESDGTYTPAELVEAARVAGLKTLAITDHDTFEGYEKAAALAGAGFRLLRGIELNTRHGGRSIHLLAYYPGREPGRSLTSWLHSMVAARRDRNRRLVARLVELGVDITLEEVERLGRSLTGRPHFARVLVEKGYAADREEAFTKYIGESGAAFVERDSPSMEETLRLVRESGGISSLPHPIRLSGGRDWPGDERLIEEFRGYGLDGLEAYHSDHSPDVAARYLKIAERLGLAPTGGSDFHGLNKPNARLGYGSNGLVPVPDFVVSSLESR